MQISMLKRCCFAALAILTFCCAVLFGQGLQAQTPSPSPSESPTATPSPAAATPSAPAAVPVAPLPGSATEYKPPSPSPTASPSPNGLPSLPGGVPTNQFPLTPTPTVPAAEPLPTAGEYADPAGRFRVAILQDYRVSPIGDAVLIEKPDGAIAYTALSQPSNGGILAPDSLASIVKEVFQRGEGFQAGSTQPVPGGIQLDWSGSLTIGGNPQPVNGVIVAKSTGTQVLLMLIAATQAGAEKVPNAAAALIDSLQPIS